MEKVQWFVYRNGVFVGSTHAVSEKQACANVIFRSFGKDQSERKYLAAFLAKATPKITKRPAKFQHQLRAGFCTNCKYSENRVGILCPNCEEVDLQQTRRRK
ncbi:MAG: hypothetical protein L3J07_03555 [Candidatus Magasanikbacteria bacterium]|nr:hypothetical protein [Candidatus Magasanikbacteria bacterium]